MIRNCCKKRREIRIHEILSNGQHLNVYFKKHSGFHKPITSVWTIGVCISDTRKDGNRWYNKRSKLDLQQTGRVGLEGLQRTLKIIKKVVNELSPREELQIGWEDKKRKKAYRYLLRYGFQETGDCYVQRNPKYWEWILD